MHMEVESNQRAPAEGPRMAFRGKGDNGEPPHGKPGPIADSDPGLLRVSVHGRSLCAGAGVRASESAGPGAAPHTRLSLGVPTAAVAGTTLPLPGPTSSIRASRGPGGSPLDDAAVRAPAAPEARQQGRHPLRHGSVPGLQHRGRQRAAAVGGDGLHRSCHRRSSVFTLERGARGAGRKPSPPGPSPGARGRAASPAGHSPPTPSPCILRCGLQPSPARTQRPSHLRTNRSNRHANKHQLTPFPVWSRC